MGNRYKFKGMQRYSTPTKVLLLDELQSLIDTLFDNGEQGAMYIPKPVVRGEQALFQDAAGTIPVTADGDPVGMMKDISGNENHAVQEVSAERPLYRTDGARNWIEFDGEGDQLISAFSNGQTTSMTSAVRADNDNGVFLGNTTSRPRWYMQAHVTGPGIRFGVVQSFAATDIDLSVVPGVCTAQKAQGAADSAYVNEEALTSTDSGDINEGLYHLGGFGSYNSKCDMYGVVLRGALLTGDELRDLRNYLETLTGA